MKFVVGVEVVGDEAASLGAEEIEVAGECAVGAMGDFGRAPDCGLGFLGTRLSMEKLTVLCNAANQI